MTRKHFVALANELNYARPVDLTSETGRAAYEAWERAVKAVCIACRSANSAFDAERFRAACGVVN